jgi:toxin CcdB
MARFDIFALRDEAGFLLDCQTDLLTDLNTRFVVPLLPEAEAPRPAARLNPVFDIRGQRMVMVTQFAATAGAKELGEPIASLRERQEEILDALDMLISGF